MSCHIKQFAHILDLDNVLKTLYTSEHFTSEDFEDDSWNWSVEESGPQYKENWMDECLLSLSPTSELLVLARERNLMILKAKWDSNEETESKIKYSFAWSGDITQEFSERISCVLCLPVAGQGKLSAHCGADWTAIAVGFTSGAVRFYTEKGSLLLSETLHDEPVTSLKFQSYQPTVYSNSLPQVDELHVGYAGSIICCVQGFALCNTLKACRNQLARLQAKCGERIEAPPLDLVKWSLPEQETISDICVLGSIAATMYGHLTTASLRGGFYANYRTGPPQISTVLAAGASPYFAWHCIVEGTSGPVLSDVAKAVASKLKSAIGSAVPNWFGAGRRVSEDKPKEKIPLETAEAMACRFGLCDKLRKGERVYLSPQKNLSVVCDALGRVILVDNLNGLALRMWKGYRDAQCAFISVDEDENVNPCRKALFLAIYAPKKGIIEIWALQQGPRLVTFPASKTGRLLYVKHGLMGANSVSMKSSNVSHHPCVFINNNGEISEIVVPFHAILCNKSNVQSKDSHILKQLKKMLTSNKELQVNEFLELCEQLTTNEVRLQVLEAAATSKTIKPELMQSILDIFKDDMIPPEGEENEDNKKYSLACRNLRKLVEFYISTYQYLDAPPEYNSVVSDSPAEDAKELAKLLRLSESDIHKIFSLTNSVSNTKASVKFKHSEDRFPIFLESFLHSYKEDPPLTFSPNTSIEDLAVIGEVLCQCVLYGSFTIDEWKVQALNCGINAKSLMYAAVSYWLKKPLGKNMRSEVYLFMQILQTITSLVALKDTFSWWDRVRSCIIESNNLYNALTMTVIARAVYLSTEEQASDEDGEWETISRESCLWTQLMSQVEAAAVLQSVISCKRKTSSTSSNVPSLEFIKPDISLFNILTKGPGLVSESVAKWVCAWGFPSSWLNNNVRAPPQPLPQIPPNQSKLGVVEGIEPMLEQSEEPKLTTDEEEEMLEKLSLLREYFSYSLAASPLIANVTCEYLAIWTKQPDRTELLSTAIIFLSSIISPLLKLGLCSIIWNVYLKVHFENTVKLLHKIGKLPKERLCQQHLNMLDSNVKHFLKSLRDFLTIFSESYLSGIYEEKQGAKTFIKREGLWVSETQPSLAEIAMAQGKPNPQILNIQNQCTTALWFLASFPIRLYKPVTSLFHSIEETQLWVDIKSKTNYPSPSPDPKLEEARTQFLIKVIKAAIEKHASLEGDPNSLQEMVIWIGHCFSLANDWSLPTEPLKIQQVAHLYSNCCDTYAREVVNSVNNREALGQLLLTVVGERMKKIINNSRQLLKERMANLSPSLTKWIQEQNESSKESNMNDIVQLSILVVNLLPENSPDHKFSVLLTEAIQPLAK